MSILSNGNVIRKESSKPKRKSQSPMGRVVNSGATNRTIVLRKEA